jgi:hypothetical protein
MKLRIGVLIIILGVIFGSCNKQKSFSQYKKEERAAIAALIAKEGFEILHTYPGDGVFGEKQFVLLDNECYLNVIDSGNGRRAVEDKTLVLMRASYIGITESDTTTYSIFSNAFAPLEFTYGRMNEAKYRMTQNAVGDGFYFLSPGVESALKYVGDGAIVRMIIPFDNGQYSKYPNNIGSAYQDDARIPMYLDKVRFVFDEY